MLYLFSQSYVDFLIYLVNIALQCGAKCIGVNNRNLHTFKLDLDTTKRAIESVQRAGKTWRPTALSLDQPDVTIAALSGITVRNDILSFKELGVSCCLIGETLMKSNNPAGTICDLLGKICREFLLHTYL